MKKSIILSLLQKKFGHIKTTGNSDQISVNCPFCVMRGNTPSTTYKLSINLEIKKYHCFRCDISGNLSNLLPQLNVISEKLETTIEETDKKEQSLEPYPVFQYLHSLSYPWDKLVFGFLLDKGFSPASVNSKIHFVEDYKKNNFSFGPRLLFPIYQMGDYKGFQARTIYKNTDPKYIGASNMERKKILYNYDKAFSQNEMLVITEGFFDCLRVGDCAIATLGKNITSTQLRMIQLGSFKKIIIFLDKDADKEAYENANKLKKYFATYVAKPDWKKLPLLPNGKKKKDPGDMTKEEITETFDKHLERIY